MTIQWDQLIAADSRAAAALAEARATAHAALATRIAAARSALITDLPGQQMIYLAKEAEARAFLADPAPDLAAYPLLAAEVGLTAPMHRRWPRSGSTWPCSGAMPQPGWKPQGWPWAPPSMRQQPWRRCGRWGRRFEPALKAAFNARSNLAQE